MKWILLFVTQLSILEGKRHDGIVRTKKVRTADTIVRAAKATIETKGPKLQKGVHHKVRCSVMDTNTWKDTECDDATSDDVTTNKKSGTVHVRDTTNKKSNGGTFHFRENDVSSSHEKASPPFEIVGQSKGKSRHPFHDITEMGKGKGKGDRKHNHYKGKGGKGKKSKKSKGEKRGKGKKKKTYSGYYITQHPTLQPAMTQAPSLHPTTQIVTTTQAPSLHPTTQIVTQRPVIVDPPPRKPDLVVTLAPTPGRQNDTAVCTYHTNLTNE